MLNIELNAYLRPAYLRDLDTWGEDTGIICTPSLTNSMKGLKQFSQLWIQFHQKKLEPWVGFGSGK